MEIRGEWEEAAAVFRRALRRAPSASLRVEILALLAQNHLRRGEYSRCTALCRKALADKVVSLGDAYP